MKQAFYPLSQTYMCKRGSSFAKAGKELNANER